MRVLFNIQRLICPSAEKMAGLEKILREKTLKKSEFFLRENAVCTDLAFIEKGSIRYYYQLEDREVCKDFIFENGLIGSYASFLSGEPSAVNMQAIEETCILQFSYQDMHTLFEQYPVWRKLAQVFIQEQFVKAEKREAALLKDLPETRFRTLIEEHPKIFKRVPLTYIASYLGITRETLSRYRAKIKQ